MREVPVASRVYVVDDERYIRAAILAVLTEAGHEPHGFASAEEFYTRLVGDARLPDLVILDQMLPDEDGAQIVRSLRERPQYRDIPVLFLTAVSDEDASRLRDLAPVVRKPFDFRDLMAAVEAALGGAERVEG
jgi:DNA-binding response OmpR family regulator